MLHYLNPKNVAKYITHAYHFNNCDILEHLKLLSHLYHKHKPQRMLSKANLSLLI